MAYRAFSAHQHLPLALSISRVLLILSVLLASNSIRWPTADLYCD